MEVNIRDVHRRLIESSGKQLTDPSIQKDLELSKNFKTQHCCSSQIYLDEMNFINQNIPPTINQNTVGSYLYGCFLPDITINIECTPECSNGLTNPQHDICQFPTYEKSDNQLININEGSGSNALLFLPYGSTITNADILLLKNNGVKVVSIYTRDENTIDYVFNKTSNVDELEETPATQQPPPPTSYAWLWWLLFIILVIFILFLAFSALRQ